ncbi:hypothetical protein D5018_02300 [Parashewanella curva]|uniref:Uncharacterized protein n=2 Tax=Parashewanella curva TaxID=2338552 RepID=A0A3L8Q1I5_9GAMM|nr:hypothetical protein D5018_02300 [Parashewanella curva]
MMCGAAAGGPTGALLGGLAPTVSRTIKCGFSQFFNCGTNESRAVALSRKAFNLGVTAGLSYVINPVGSASVHFCSFLGAYVASDVTVWASNSVLNKAGVAKDSNIRLAVNLVLGGVASHYGARAGATIGQYRIRIKLGGPEVCQYYPGEDVELKVGIEQNGKSAGSIIKIKAKAGEHSYYCGEECIKYNIESDGKQLSFTGKELFCGELTKPEQVGSGFLCFEYQVINEKHEVVGTAKVYCEPKCFDFSDSSKIPKDIVHGMRLISDEESQSIAETVSDKIDKHYKKTGGRMEQSCKRAAQLTQCDIKLV